MNEKTKILFVDDDPLVLQGLKRLLWSMRDAWDMVFVDSGAKGLEALSANPFDVVVSDLRMPGMNGAEFLNRVMGLYPQTIRLVLSGYAEQDLVLQVEGAAHQFLSKPCDPELLKNVIFGAGRVSGGVRSLEIRKALGGVAHLPSLPATFLLIQKMLRSETTTAEDLGAVVQRDPGLSANILKLVNSAYFGLRQRVSSPSEAVAFLGVETLKSLALLHGVFHQIKGGPHGFNSPHLWDHSLKMASASRDIALFEGLDRTGQSDSFTGGLLHDVGLLLLVSAFPDKYAEVTALIAREPLDIAAAEARVLGVNHAEVGGYLLTLWGLPTAVAQAVSRHHDPGLPEPPIDPAAIVRGAEILTGAQGDGMVFGIRPGTDFHGLPGARLQAWKDVIDPILDAGGHP